MNLFVFSLFAALILCKQNIQFYIFYGNTFDFTRFTLTKCTNTQSFVIFSMQLKDLYRFWLWFLALSATATTCYQKNNNKHSFSNFKTADSTCSIKARADNINILYWFEVSVKVRVILVLLDCVYARIAKVAYLCKWLMRGVGCKWEWVNNTTRVIELWMLNACILLCQLIMMRVNCDALMTRVDAEVHAYIYCVALHHPFLEKKWFYYTNSLIIHWFSYYLWFMLFV